jgi:hypothetical protein
MMKLVDDVEPIRGLDLDDDTDDTEDEAIDKT